MPFRYPGPTHVANQIATKFPALHKGESILKLAIGTTDFITKTDLPPTSVRRALGRNEASQSLIICLSLYSCIGKVDGEYAHGSVGDRSSPSWGRTSGTRERMSSNFFRSPRLARSAR